MTYHFDTKKESSRGVPAGTDKRGGIQEEGVATNDTLMLFMMMIDTKKETHSA